jgi:hypothetical protein
MALNLSAFETTAKKDTSGGLNLSAFEPKKTTEDNGLNMSAFGGSDIKTEKPVEKVSVFNNPKPYQIPIEQQKSYPKPPVEPDQSFFQKVPELLDNLKTFVLGGYTQKEKEIMGTSSITPKSVAVPTMTINGQKTNIPVSGLPTAPNLQNQPKLESANPKQNQLNELNDLSNKLDSLKNNNQIDEYNKLVPDFN